MNGRFLTQSAEAQRRQSEKCGRCYDGFMKPPSYMIELLEMVCSRKQMYFEHANSEAVDNFIQGFLIACHGFEFFPKDCWNEVADERGWGGVAKSPRTLMRERGMKDEAISEELFEILMETVRRMFSRGATQGQ